MTVTCTNAGQVALTADFTLTIESPCNLESLVTSVEMPLFFSIPLYSGDTTIATVALLEFDPAVCLQGVFYEFYFGDPNDSLNGMQITDSTSPVRLDTVSTDQTI